MGTIKDRNGMNLTEAEILRCVGRIFRRRGKNTQKNCMKKIFTTQTTMMM